MNIELILPPAFPEFPKIARLNRACVISEKIDGTNAQVNIRDESGPFDPDLDSEVVIDGAGYYVRAGSRSQWIGVHNDNFGFAGWVRANAEQLAALGVGAHFGEWWGSGIQRRYAQDRKRFSLFNTSRWNDDALRPACCDVVPVLYADLFTTDAVVNALETLRDKGSVAAPGFMNPEGVICWHEAARIYFKKTLHKDDEWKGKVAA